MMYKEASRQGIRFQTTKGLLAVEQLWSLNTAELDSLAVELNKEYKESGGKSYIRKKTSKDKLIKLKFDIVLDILNTKVDEEEAAREAADKREKRQKILQLIADKKDSELADKSIKELEAMLD